MNKLEEFRSILLNLEGLDMRTKLDKPITGKTILSVWYSTKNYLDKQDAPDEEFEFDIFLSDDIEAVNVKLLELWWHRRTA